MRKRSSSARRSKRPRYRPSLALQLDPHYQTLELLPLADGTVDLVARLATVCDLVGASPAKLYRQMKCGSRKLPVLFPRPIRLGGRDKGKVAWVWREVQAWQMRCISISATRFVPYEVTTRTDPYSANMTVVQPEWSGQPEPLRGRAKGKRPGVMRASPATRRAERDFESSAAKDETDHRIFAAGVLPERGGRPVITRDIDDHAYIAQLDALVREIVQTNAGPVGWEENGAGSRRYFLTDLGGKLRHAAAVFSDHFLLQHARHQFSPRVALLLRAFERWGGIMDDCTHLYGHGVPVVDRLAFNSTVRLIRYACRSKRFCRAMDNDQRRELKEHQSACIYAAALFHAYPVLWAVRVHLYFPHADPYNHSIAMTDWSHLTLANEAFARFGRALRRNRAFAAVCGWLALRSESYVQGVHFDVLVWVAGSEQITAVEYADRLGQYWTERCTGPAHVGRALVKRPRPRSGGQINGMSPIVCTDVHGLLSIRAALRAMSSSDYQLRVNTRCEHNLRSGSIRVPGASRPAWSGKPYDLSAVMRILVGA